MGERIHAYFLTLGLGDEEASALHLRYYKTYGLALRGLVRHHNIDPLDFDKRCDQSIPLEEMLRPDPTVRKLLQDIDRTKVRVWALTNAYVTVRIRPLYSRCSLYFEHIARSKGTSSIESRRLV